MLRGWRTKRILLAVMATCSVVALTVTFALPMKAQEDPPLKRLMRGRHRLLRKVYVNSPDTDVKGLAASIKADEITCKHRIRAVRYLSTVDSVEYPEAKRMLVETMHNDNWEVVRFEAAKALRVMMSGGADSRANTPRLFRQWFRMWRRHTRRAWRRRVTGRRDYWVDVCDPQTLNALVRTAYEQDANGVCFEPSLRVRQAAVRAIIVSGVECDVGPYRVSANNGVSPNNFDVRPNIQPQWSDRSKQVPDDFQPMEPFETGSDTFIELGNYEPEGHESPAVLLAAGQIDVEWQPVKEPETVSVPTQMIFDDSLEIDFDPSDFEPLPGTPTSEPVAPEPKRVDIESPLTKTAPALNGFCIVELRRTKKKVLASSEYRTAYAGRLYEFSSAEAKDEFYGSPDKYALAYGGYDPVAFATSEKMLEGIVLCEHAGRLYAFVSAENRREFLVNPKPYSIGPPVASTEPTFDLTEDPEPVRLEPTQKSEERNDKPNEFEVDALSLIPPVPEGPVNANATETERERAAKEADLADIDFGDTDDAIAAAGRVLASESQDNSRDNDSDREIAPPPPPFDEEPIPPFNDVADAEEEVAWETELDDISAFADDAPERPLAPSDVEIPTPTAIADREATDNPSEVFGGSQASEEPTNGSVSLVEDFPWDGDWKESGETNEPAASRFFESASPMEPNDFESQWAPLTPETREPQRPRVQQEEPVWQSSEPSVGMRRRSSYFDSALRVPERGMRVAPITAAAKRSQSITRQKIAGWTKPVQPVRRSSTRSLSTQRSRVASVRPVERVQQTTSVRPVQSKRPSSSLVRPRRSSEVRPVSTSDRQSGSVSVFSITGRKKQSAVRHAAPERR